MIKTYDPIAKSGYLQFSKNPVAYTRNIQNSIVCDFDAHGTIIGIEIIDCLPTHIEAASISVGIHHNIYA
jgi:uncharacterized protein YuzE